MKKQKLIFKPTITAFILVVFISTFFTVNHSYACGDMPPKQFETDSVSSWDGYGMNPRSTYRLLVLMINIKYDIDPALDPLNNSTCPRWGKATFEGVVPPDSTNQFPDFLENMLDVTFNPDSLKGMQTKKFYESSFGELILLGDYVVVNVKHSSLVDINDTVFTFKADTLMKKAAQIINDSGGLNAVYGHNSVNDYNFNVAEPGFFDFVQVMIRNSTTGYGSYNYFHGTSGYGPRINILFNEGYAKSQRITTQGVRCDNFNDNPVFIHYHELSHYLFGGNNFHTSGGHGWNSGYTMVYPSIQYGYGLMGGASSGLGSCNGFDRYRIGWMHPDNQTGWPITVNGAISDIEKSDGNKTFILRDFITTGDVIRIKLPYISPDAANQYIWIENHKMLPETFDFLQYSNTHDHCRPQAEKGIYAYYQVGKDVLFGHPDTVFANKWLEADNLKFICANGNYDIYYQGAVPGSCVTYNDFHHFSDSIPNPMQGYNDVMAFYHVPYLEDTIVPQFHAFPAQAKTYTNDTFVDNLPYLMSNLNAFSGHKFINLSSNPGSFNTKTYYHKPDWKSGFIRTEPHLSHLNERYIQLSGLQIEMIPLANDDYQVNIRWNHYNVDNDTRWTGNINLHEKIILLDDKVLSIDQNYTPNTIYRDETTGVFSAPSHFYCLPGSYFEQRLGSEVIVENLSTLELEAGSRYQIDGGTLRIKEGSHFIMRPCAELEIINGGQLIIESGATICLHDEAIIVYDDYSTNFDFQNGFLFGGCLPFTAANFEQMMGQTPYRIISANTTWSGKYHKFNQNLIIQTGNTLTINNESLVLFNPESGIIVERGAKLIVDNSTLSNLCKSEFWQGVTVMGNHSKQQNGTYQGMVVLANGSTIENAHIGVMAGLLGTYNPIDKKSTEFPIPDNYQYNGGIVIAAESNFINNRIAVYLPPYENRDPVSGIISNNVNRFYNCNFELTTESLTLSSISTFIKLNGVRGIRIHGNRFENKKVIGLKSEHIGIESLNSSFNVGYLSGGNRRSSFENLNYGIRALGTGSEKTFTVDSALFIDNINGIFSSQINNFTIIRSVFGMENFPSSTHSDFGFVYVEGPSYGFTIEENIFYQNSSPIETKRISGTVFINTGEFSNQLYNNTFSKLNVGTWAMNINKSRSMPEIGLCIRCNDYSQNFWDIMVTTDSLHAPWAGIANQQGSYDTLPNSPAGNRFSHYGAGGRPTDFNNQTSSTIYYYYHAGTNADHRLEPWYYRGIVPVANFQAPWNAQSCPSNLIPPGGGHDEEALMCMMAKAEQKADSTQTQINMLKDAGDTQALHWDVSMSAPWQGMEVYSELMSVSPYVSDTVLDAAIEKENVLVDAMIRDVLVANPHSAKSETLMEKLDQRIQPLPGYMLDEILQGQSLVSVYENLQSSLSHYLQKQALYKKQLVQLYLNDTIQPAAAADSLVNLLLASNHPAHWYRAAFMRHAQGDSVASAAILSSIPTSFSLSTEQLQSHSQVVSWLDQESLLHSQEKSLAVPDSAAIAWLIDKMDNAVLPASIYARNILLAHSLVEHQPEYLLPDDTKSTPLKRPRSQSTPEVEMLKLFPNPAREYVIVDFDIVQMKADERSGTLKISSMEGKLIEALPLTKPKDQLVFPLKGYQPGTYVFTLYFGNKMHESKRLIIR